jgi:glycosyltransferase involved in cell wall biosynthesis
MKVAIDSGPLTSGHAVRGIGVATKTLIDSILKYNKEKDVHVVPVDFTSADLTDFDILHYTSFNPYMINPQSFRFLDKKVIITIHDLIPLIYPKQYPLGIKGFLKFQLNKLLVGSARQIITVSETSKKDIVRFTGVDKDKVDVIYWAPDPSYKRVTNKEYLSEIRAKYHLPEKFILYVGDVNYNKNLSTLIEACNLLDLRLVIVGKQAKNLDQLVESYKSLNGPKDFIRLLFGIPHPELSHFNKLTPLIAKSDVVTTGYVDTKDLAGIYSMASVYCQPSFYEGFGIPVLEAFACETPVVISKTQALVEVAKGAALIADPNSAEDLSDKILSLINDSTTELHLTRAGLKRVEEFSWENTAKKTIEIYKKVYRK